MRQLNENYSNRTGVSVLGTASPSEMGQIFSYNGNSVRMCKMNGYILICLTDFAKPFPDKNLSHIVNSKEITDYVTRLSEIQNCSSVDLLQITKGGDVTKQGTWAHHRVAIRVAQKLSTDFAIWVDERIEELLQYGMTATQPTLEQMINNPDFIISLATQLKSERKEKERLYFEIEQRQKKIEQKDAKIAEMSPKAEFADCFLSCKGDITIGELANILNQSCLFSKGRNKLREWLRKNGYLIKRGTRKNKPTQKSMSLHLMRIASTLCNTGEKNVFREEVMVTARGQKHFITQFRALLSSKESYEIEW